MAARTPSIHVFLGRPLFLLSPGIHSIINSGSLSSCILLTWPYHWSLFLSMISTMSGFSFNPIISFICSFFISGNLLQFKIEACAEPILVSKTAPVMTMRYDTRGIVRYHRQKRVPVLHIVRYHRQKRVPVLHIETVEKKKPLDSFGPTHICSYTFSRTQIEQSSVSLHFEGFSSKFVLSLFTRHFSLELMSPCLRITSFADSPSLERRPLHLLA